jgi:hypothetical protein
MNRVRNTLICAAMLGLLVGAAPALATYQEVIRDCAEDGQLDGSYSQSELDQARNRLPSDLDEYSDCREVIAAASNGGRDRGASGGTGGGSGGAAATPQDELSARNDASALDSAARKRRKPRVAIGGTPVEPGKNGLFDSESAADGMPLSLLLALIAIGLLAAGGGAYALRRRIPGLANFSLPRPSLSRVSLPRLRR